MSIGAGARVAVTRVTSGARAARACVSLAGGATPYNPPVPRPAPREPKPPPTSAPTPSAAAAPRPARLPRTGCIAAVAAAILFLALTIQKICVPDLWWQLRTGQLILESRRWPATDALSYTASSHEWIEMRWVFCVLAHLGYSVGGPAALIFGQAIVLAATFVILLWPLRRTLLTPAGLAVLLLGLATVQIRFNVRPEMFTYLFMAASITLLDAAARPGVTAAARRRLWLLPVLQVLWTNTHTVFVLGPVIAWAFALGDAAHRLLRLGGLGFAHTANAHEPARRFDARLFLVAAATTAATLVNPWFHKGALFPVTLLTETMGSSLGLIIQELVPPMHLWPGWTIDLWASAAFVVVSGVSFLLNWRRTDLIRLGLWAALLVLALKSVRNFGPWGFVALWATLRNIESWRAARPVAGVSRAPLAAATNLALGAIALFGAWYVASDRLAGDGNSPRRFGLGVTPWLQPVGALEFMKANGVRGRVFHSMNDGSYLAFAAPGAYPVYLDGRLEVYTEPLVVRLLDLAANIEDWDRFTARYGINAALVQRDLLQPAIPRLAARKDWPIVYLDDRCVLFVRDIPEHAALIAAHRIDPRAPMAIGAGAPDEQATGLPSWLGGRPTPWWSFGMARTLLALGAVENAAAYLERAAALQPGHRRCQLLLSTIYRAQGRTKEADERWALAAPNEDDRRFAEQHLAECHRMLGHREEWLAALKARAESSPRDARAWRDYAQAAQESGDAATAAGALERAARLDPLNLTLRRQLGLAYEAANRLPEAIAVYEFIASQRSPDAARRPLMPDAFLRLASCLQRANRADDALEAAREGVRLVPDYAELHNEMGILLARRGDLAGARAAFAEAVRLRPDFEGAKSNLERLKSYTPPAAAPK